MLVVVVVGVVALAVVDVDVVELIVLNKYDTCAWTPNKGWGNNR